MSTRFIGLCALALGIVEEEKKEDNYYVKSSTPPVRWCFSQDNIPGSQAFTEWSPITRMMDEARRKSKEEPENLMKEDVTCKLHLPYNVTTYNASTNITTIIIISHRLSSYKENQEENDNGRVLHDQDLTVQVLCSDPTQSCKQRNCLHEHWRNCHDYPEVHTWEARDQKDIEEEEAVRALVAAEDDNYLAYDEACRVRQLNPRCWQEGYYRTNEGHMTRGARRGDENAKVAIGIGRRQLCPEDDQRQQIVIAWCKTSNLRLLISAGRGYRWDALQRAGFDPLSGRSDSLIAESLFFVTILLPT
ncbi:hypothetical protein EI94DRAFT_1706935 [Lactarius quietus]|nr:hypothetical protein EI94DRAFT_1706935 [Lactarius quietus]